MDTSMPQRAQHAFAQIQLQTEDRDYMFGPLQCAPSLKPKLAELNYREHGRACCQLAEDPMRLLAGYAWPIRVAAVLAGTVLISSNLPAYAVPNKQILDRAEAYKEPALKLLGVLVNTDSGSGDDKGLVWGDRCQGSSSAAAFLRLGSV